MLLIAALVVAILFGGFGFAAHILWFGVAVGLVIAIAFHVTKGLTRGI